MGYTLSFHNGSRCSLDHNRRKKEVVSKEKHINPNGHYEIWKDAKLYDAYNDLFGSALDEYNEKIKDKHPERIQTVKEYLNSLFAKKDKAKNAKKPIYECIIQIGSKNCQPAPEVSRAILREYIDKWNEINPNMYLVGCYFHADEEGGCHIHVSYVPYAESKRGMSIQPSLTKALKSMGYSDKDINHTAQMEWQKAQRDILTKLCTEHGIEIEDVVGGRKHLDTLIFKMQKELEDLNEQNQKQEERTKRLQEIHNKLSSAGIKEVERLYGVENNYKNLQRFVAKILSAIREMYDILPEVVKSTLQNIINSFFPNDLNKENDR